jgi:hypothetical protein
LILPINETLRPWGRPQILPIDETLRLRGRPITLSIYQDLIADHELPLQASSLALSPVPYDLAYGVPLQAANLALLLVCRFRAYLSAFEPLASLHSLGLMLHKCEFCTALYFIQEAVASTQERFMFKSYYKKRDVSLELLNSVPPYLQSLYKS